MCHYRAQGWQNLPTNTARRHGRTGLLMTRRRALRNRVTFTSGRWGFMKRMKEKETNTHTYAPARVQGCSNVCTSFKKCRLNPKPPLGRKGPSCLQRFFFCGKFQTTSTHLPNRDNRVRVEGCTWHEALKKASREKNIQPFLFACKNKHDYSV